MTLKIFDLKVRFLFSPPLGRPFFAKNSKNTNYWAETRKTLNCRVSTFSVYELMYGMGWDGMGWDGWMEYQKCPSNFFILWGYIEHVYTYLYIYILKNCHQHSYGFQNFMPSWGSLSKISQLQLVGDFSFFTLKIRFHKV